MKLPPASSSTARTRSCCTRRPIFFCSRASAKALDQRGLHRLHALGVEVNGRAVLVLLPMGGGKSTLALHLLSLPGVRLLSDDSPWIDRTGRALAYPLRIGLLPGSEQSIPAQHRRMIQRMEFGPKHLVNFSYFQDRVCGEAEPGVVFIGARTLLPDCRIEEIGLAAALRPMIANGVIGLGLFQGLEFILQSSARGTVPKDRAGLFAHAQLLAAIAPLADLSRALGPGRRVQRAHRAGILAKTVFLSVSECAWLAETTRARESLPTVHR